jgi:hypothetical protein
MVDALSDLPLRVIHIAAAKGHYFTAVDDGRVTATALDPVLVLRPIINVTPFSEAIVRAGARNNAYRRYLLVSVVVLAADEVDLRADRDQARVLSRRRQPIL